MPIKKLPKIDVDRCIGCGHCVLACHPKALKLVNGVFYSCCTRKM